jgi:O-antigen ligase
VTIDERTRGEIAPAGGPAGHLLLIPLVSIWLLLLASFSLPGRTGNESLASLDALALFKAGVRAVVVGALVVAILAPARLAGRAAVASAFGALGLFVLWAFASSLWSPLPAVSVGQAVTLLAQLLLAVAIALSWRTAASTSTVLAHLTAALLVTCVTLLAVHAANPELSGFSRDNDDGLFHPTKIGRMASLGLVLVLACRLIWDWRWTRVLLLPSLVVFPIVLVMAASRAALGLTIVLVVILLGTMGNRRRLGALALAGSLAAIVYPIADPGLDAARHVVGAAADYARRGESAEMLRSLTGRTELWRVLLDSFREAPLAGHGYFVMSKDGAVDVWNDVRNRGAHNVVLQVAVSTGLVGLLLFAGGLWRAIVPACRRLVWTAEDCRLRRLAAAAGLWYLGAGVVSESFMGALAPDSIAAFALLGLIAGFREQEGGSCSN